MAGRTIRVFLGDHETVDYIFSEEEIGAPTTRDSLTIAKRILASWGTIPDGMPYELRLYESSRYRAGETGTWAQPQ